MTQAIKYLFFAILINMLLFFKRKFCRVKFEIFTISGPEDLISRRFVFLELRNKILLLINKIGKKRKSKKISN